PAGTRSRRPFPTRRSSDLSAIKIDYIMGNSNLFMKKSKGGYLVKRKFRILVFLIIFSFVLTACSNNKKDVGGSDTDKDKGKGPRSEEHTSELQSREKLVCR